MFRYTILQEAKKIKGTDTEEEATDYTDATEEAEPMEKDTETEEVDMDDEELEATDYGEDEPTEDGETTEGEDDLEATDYGDDTEGGEEPMEDGETPTEDEVPEEETNEENPSKVNKLLEDFIHLYDTVNICINKLNNVSDVDLFTNKITLEVNKKMNILLHSLYKYIILSFSKNDYVFNVYQFNLFIQAINVNIEILKKNNELVYNK